MSTFFSNRKTTPSSIGHMALAGVFIAVPLLMFLPNIIVGWDASSASIGEHVWIPYTNVPGPVLYGDVEQVNGNTVVVRMSDGSLQTFAASDIHEP